MNLVKKALLFYQKEGLRNTVTRIGQKCWELISQIPNIAKEKLFLNKYLEQIKSSVAGKQLYIVISGIDWNIPLFQRSHQIAVSLARQENTHVLFVSDGYRYDNFAGICAINKNLDLISRRVVDKIRPAIECADNICVFMSWPRQAKLLEHIPYDKLVYEYIDDISLFYYYTEEMRAKHYQLIREADLTVCTARTLYEDAKPIAKKILLSPNAGDFDFFYNNRNCPVEPTLKEKIEKYDCVLGYYGCLAEWFDYELVIEVAKKKTDWCFVLVGYCFDGTVSRLQKEALPNIIIYPAQPYVNLPSFVAAFDIQIIPFVLNDITKATSPVKLFEYMASGKPILTSAMQECLQYKSVRIYHDSDDFISKAAQLLDLKNDEDYLERMLEEARDNTWEARVQEILKTLYGGNDDEK